MSYQNRTLISTSGVVVKLSGIKTEVLSDNLAVFYLNLYSIGVLIIKFIIVTDNFLL